MNDEQRPAPAEGPAYRRLDEHLELLRLAPPELQPALAAHTVRAARWQREVRAPLRIACMIAAALLDGVLGLIAPDAREPRR